jgi:hypothetical protein
MSSLIAWAVAEAYKYITELQSQGFLLEEMHKVLYQGEVAIQEMVLENKNCMCIPLSGYYNSVVILKLKKLNGSTGPTLMK